MTDVSIHYWAAVEHGIYRANSVVENDKTYYTFHGPEQIYSMNIGDIVQWCALPENITKNWIIFEYVPLPSTMMRALWNVHNNNLKQEDVSFKTRIHSFFTFPHSERLSSIVPTEKVISIDAALATTTESAVPSPQIVDSAIEALNFVSNRLLADAKTMAKSSWKDGIEKDAATIVILVEHLKSNKMTEARILIAETCDAYLKQELSQVLPKEMSNLLQIKI
jgi:hypothetical protein